MNYKSNIYEILDPKIYGVDIDWVPASARSRSPLAGQVLHNDQGDLKLVEGPLLVVQNRVRELMTPYGFYGRYVEDFEGIHLVDGDYGNQSYYYLSEPSNTLPIDQISNECTRIMLKDARVKSAYTIPDLYPEVGILLIRIEFALLDGSEGSFQISLNPR